jgi:hypothetical protein
VKLGYAEPAVDKICKLIELHDTKIGSGRQGIEAMLKIIGIEELELLLIHQEADLLAHSPSYILRKLDGLKKVQKAFALVKSGGTIKGTDNK